MTFAVILLVILVLGLVLAWWAGLFAVRRVERRVLVDALDRRYIVWLPVGAKKKAPLPVVLAFHGGFGSAGGFEEMVQLHRVREAEDFIIVYPEGYKRSWNAGDCCGPALRDNINERKFVFALLDDLEAVMPIDRRRIYATGHSNGGQLCYYLAATLPGLFAAIAPVGCHVVTAPPPREPLPIFHLHGIEDKWVPYEGGVSVWKNAPMRGPVEANIEIWRHLAGANQATRETMFDGEGDCTCFSGGVPRCDIRLCRIRGLGHHWPGAQSSAQYQQFVKTMRVSDLGPLGPAVPAGDAILSFFKTHALAAPVTGATVRQAGWTTDPDLAFGQGAFGKGSAG